MSQLISEILRPMSFDELAIDESISLRLNSMCQNKNIMNMIFYGKPGSGKTTAARIFQNANDIEALQVNGRNSDYKKDALSTITKFSTSVSMFEKSKLCIVDEAESLPKSIQKSLRSVIEDTSLNCRFIFTTNHLKTIDPALQSRMLTINFDTPPYKAVDVIKNTKTE